MTISKYGILLVVFVLLALTSCLKKDDIPDLSAVDPVIEFPLGGPGMKRNNLTAPANSTNYTAIPDNLFQLEVTDITIRAGYRVGRIKVKIHLGTYSQLMQ